jgi:hypothetical protein
MSEDEVIIFVHNDYGFSHRCMFLMALIFLQHYFFTVNSQATLNKISSINKSRGSKLKKNILVLKFEILILMLAVECIGIITFQADFCSVDEG